MRTCSLDECERPRFSREFCRLHFERWKKHGDPYVRGRPGPKSLKTKAGDVYGRLTVIEDTGERYDRDPVFLVKCECGTIKKVRGTHLRHKSWATKSCGCLQREIASHRKYSDEERRRRATGFSRRHRLKKLYGLTVEEADEMLAKGCAICEKKELLCIDHDHGNGKPRAALCRSCNSMLGMSGDSAERLRKGAEYLDSF